MDQKQSLNTQYEKKTTRREAYTTRAIEECFLELLQQKTIDKITVAEVCTKADVNRSTFYRHYEDLYILLDSIADRYHQEIFDNIIATVSFEPNFEKMGYHYILKVCEITQQKKDVYKLLLFGATPTNLQQRIAESSFDLYITAHTQRSSLKPAPELELHYKYLVNGMLAVWTTWIQNDCKLPKEVVANVVKHQISAFFSCVGQLYSGRAELK